MRRSRPRLPGPGVWSPLPPNVAGASSWLSRGCATTRTEQSWARWSVTPNHPEYPSAHSCATTAFARVVAALGHGRLDLNLTSPTTCTTRHFTSVGQLVAEESNARVWGGLHWRFSTEAGEAIGRAVSRAVLDQAARTRVVGAG